MTEIGKVWNAPRASETSSLVNGPRYLLAASSRLTSPLRYSWYVTAEARLGGRKCADMVRAPVRKPCCMDSGRDGYLCNSWVSRSNCSHALALSGVMALCLLCEMTSRSTVVSGTTACAGVLPMGGTVPRGVRAAFGSVEVEAEVVFVVADFVERGTTKFVLLPEDSDFGFVVP